MHQYLRQGTTHSTHMYWFSCLTFKISIVLLTNLFVSHLSIAQTNGPACSNYTNRTTANGLGSNLIYDIYAIGNTIYAATTGGLSISTDGGNTFTTKTTANGLGSNFVIGVHVIGNSIYVATNSGLSISTNGGNTFINKTIDNGLANNAIQGVYAVTGPASTTIYATTNTGLSVSYDGGNTYTTKTTANGLGSNKLFKVYADGSKVYVATDNGVSISNNSGNTFINRTTADGLGDNGIKEVYAIGNTVYAATVVGLSISTDGGNTFTNKTTSNGLGDNFTTGVYAIGNTVYVANNGLSISTNGGNTFTNYTTANGLASNNVLGGVYATGSTIYVALNGGVSLCNAGPLPVKLRYFNGRMTANASLLGWETDSEVNSDHFSIERSSDAVAFETIGRVVTQALGGTSWSSITYTFTDDTPLSGINYYRLIQIDQDGTRTPSRIISLSRANTSSVLYPNPVSISGTAILEPAVPFDSYKLIDSQGRILQQIDKSGVLSRLSLAILPTGIYVLWIESKGIRSSYRIDVRE